LIHCNLSRLRLSWLALTVYLATCHRSDEISRLAVALDGRGLSPGRFVRAHVRGATAAGGGRVSAGADGGGIVAALPPRLYQWHGRRQRLPPFVVGRRRGQALCAPTPFPRHPPKNKTGEGSRQCLCCGAPHGRQHPRQAAGPATHGSRHPHWAAWPAADGGRLPRRPVSSGWRPGTGRHC